MKQSNISALTLKSGAWLYAGQIASGVVNLAAFAILARTLTPAAFGIATLAQVLLGFGVVLGTGGVSTYVTRDRADGHAERAHAAFWLNSAFCAATVPVGSLIAPAVARFYSQPVLANVLLVILVGYGINQLAAVPEALLKRELQYDKLVKRDIAIGLAAALGSVIMALSGAGVWSLVIPHVMLAPIRTLAVFVMAGWWPALPLRTNQWRTVMTYSSKVSGANVLNAIAAQGDSLVIGKVMGPAALGVYNIAWTAANVVSRKVTSVAGRLALPALSAVASDEPKLRRAYHRMLTLLAAISFPLLIGLFVAADEYILTLFGEQWTEAILPLRILIVFALRHSIGSPASVIYNVVGRPDIGLKFGLAFAPLYIVSIIIGARFGIIGVAAAVTTVRVGGGIVTFWIGARLLHEPVTRHLAALREPLLASAAMAAAMAAVELLLNVSGLAIPALRLVVLSAVGALTYIAMIITTAPAIRREFEGIWNLAPLPIRNVASRFGARLKAVETNVHHG